MVKQNQGFLKTLNLTEVDNAGVVLNNLGGAGISEDLKIIQNNLRNTSTVSYNSLSNGFFFFGSNNDFVFTNDDVINVSTNVSVGSSTLVTGTDYYVCNSDGETKFKLSTTPSSIGVSTISVDSVSPTNFNFIRKNPVYQENLINFIKPDILDTNNFDYLPYSINNSFLFTQDSIELSNFNIDRRYKTNVDTTSNNDINFEGIVTINDPSKLNTGVVGINSSKSPGIFIGNVRAFSDDNGPWQKVGTALSTSSSSVSIQELYFDNSITISGISTELATSVQASTFTHKLPVIINGETYYLLLRT